jgi:hypothetical protein
MEALYFLAVIVCLVLIVMYGVHRINCRTPGKHVSSKRPDRELCREDAYVERYIRESV